MPDDLIEGDPIAIAGRMWGSPAGDYDDISFSVSDALLHTAMRLNPAPGDRILDIATGTGMSARNAARFGASVTGIDIADGLLAAAREICADIKPKLSFIKADAAQLPFPDAAFDRAVSTFGIMFAPDQKGAAAELARVVKPGGRVVITSWAPDPAVARVFELLSEYQGGGPTDGPVTDSPAADAPSPMAWGQEGGVAELLGGDFDLGFEAGISHGYFDSTGHMWQFYARTFGPLREIVETIEPARADELKRRFMEEHDQFSGDLGLVIPRPYLLAKGIRLGAGSR